MRKMIEREWLENLKFDAKMGVKITGLAGIGSKKVAFKAEHPNGTKMIVSTYHHHLGYYIRELPLFLTVRPEYNLDSLNRKLLNLVGNPLLDSMICEYDRLYSSIILMINEIGVNDLILNASTLSIEAIDNLPFILQTSGIKRRLTDLATLTEEEESPYIEVNGPNFPIKTIRAPLIKWAKESLQLIDTMIPQNNHLKPEKLPNNPLFVWGGAAMDGFFTDEELPKVADFLKNQFGSFIEHPEVGTITLQVDAIANLLAQFLRESKVHRFVKLCALAGIIVEARDISGKIIANGFDLLRSK